MDDAQIADCLLRLVKTDYWEAVKTILYIRQGNAVSDLLEVEPHEFGRIASLQEQIKAVRWLISTVESYKTEQEVT